MAAGSDLTSQAIAPGSLPYGDRGSMEQGLSAAMASGGGGAGTQAPPPPSPTMPGDSPLAALLGGDIKPSGGPLASGLSVGSGPGPETQDDPLMGDRANRLRALATEAASPQLRALARAELRRMAREPI